MENNSQAHLSFANDGKAALELLSEESVSSQTRKPDLIVLDLKMPVIDGPTFLKELRSSPRLSSIPVVVLTGSDAESDKELAFSLGAKNYFLKPCWSADWNKLARKLEKIAFSTDSIRAI